MARLQQEQADSLRKDQAIQQIFKEQHELGDMSGSRSREDTSAGSAERHLLPPKPSATLNPSHSVAMFQMRRSPFPPSALPFHQRSKKPFDVLPENADQGERIQSVTSRGRSGQLPWGERAFQNSNHEADLSEAVEGATADEQVEEQAVRQRALPPPLILRKSNKIDTPKPDRKRFSSLSNMLSKRKLEKERKSLRKEAEARQKLQRQRELEQRQKEYELQVGGEFA